MTHELKTWPEFFDAVVSGEKTFEVRKNDRNFQVGDMLFLRRFDPEKKQYTGPVALFVVTYILHGGLFGIESGYIVMSIKKQ